MAGLGNAQVAILGSGAVDLYHALIVLGTTSWVSCHVPGKKTDVLRQITSVPSSLPGRYLVLDNHETSGRCLHWLRTVLCDPDDGTFHDFYDRLDAVADASAPGAGDVIFTPWLAGERTPVADRHARGGFHNVSLSTTRADLVRAVLEGVAFNDRWTFEAVERFVSWRLDDVRIIGGGARSDVWCQIHADVLHRTVRQVADPGHSGLRGVAFRAALTLGLLELGDVPGLVPVRATYRPRPEHSAHYDRLYHEFPRLHRTQRGMFARLNRTVEPLLQVSRAARRPSPAARLPSPGTSRRPPA